MRLLNRYKTKNNTKTEEDDGYKLEKKVIIDGEEHQPWYMCITEKMALASKGLPEYPYYEFSLYIYDILMDPIYYAELFHILRSAKFGDIIYIYINSPGGDINTLCSFSSVIEETNASVITYVDGSADSAAFVLAFMGDEIVFSEFSQMMAHYISMSINKTNMANLEKYARNTKIMYKGMLKKYCSKVLSEEEINSICENGTEIHLSSEECKERLLKWKSTNKNENNE